MVRRREDIYTNGTPHASPVPIYCTKLGIGTIPIGIREERNSRYMGRSELNSPGIHNPSGISPKWQEYFSCRNNNKINRRCLMAEKKYAMWLSSGCQNQIPIVTAYFCGLADNRLMDRNYQTLSLITTDKFQNVHVPLQKF